MRREHDSRLGPGQGSSDICPLVTLRVANTGRSVRDDTVGLFFAHPRSLVLGSGNGWVLLAMGSGVLAAGQSTAAGGGSEVPGEFGAGDHGGEGEQTMETAGRMRPCLYAAHLLWHICDTPLRFARSYCLFWTPTSLFNPPFPIRTDNAAIAQG